MNKIFINRLIITTSFITGVTVLGTHIHVFAADFAIGGTFGNRVNMEALGTFNGLFTLDDSGNLTNWNIITQPFTPDFNPNFKAQQIRYSNLTGTLTGNGDFAFSVQEDSGQRAPNTFWIGFDHLNNGTTRSITLADMANGEVGVVYELLPFPQLPAGASHGFELQNTCCFRDIFTGFAVSLDTGGSQDDPILPVRDANGRFRLLDITSGAWVDPPLVSSYQFTMDSSSSLFSGILDFPTGFNSSFTVSSGGQELGSFGPGDAFFFPGEGVSEFTISDINPLVDSEDPLAFPIQLAFNTTTASFSMTPIIEGNPPQDASTPEPSTLLGLGTLALAGTTLLRRKHNP